MHNLCMLDVKDQVRFGLFYALDFIKEAEIMEQYGKDMGLGGLEWADVFDHGYIRSQWMPNEEWFDDMTARVVDKWVSQGLSSFGGRSSVLPPVESEWWQDKSSCQKSSQRLSLCGGRTVFSQ